MVETGLASTVRCEESQIDAERCDDCLCMSRPAAAYLIEDHASHRSCVVLAGITAECRQHSGEQALMPFNGHCCQTAMSYEPIPKLRQGRRRFNRGTRKPWD